MILHQIKYSDVLKIGLIIEMFVLALIYVMSGQSYVVSLYTIFLVFTLISVNYVMLLIPKNTRNALILSFVTFQIIYFIHRILILIVYPKGYLYSNYLDYNLETINTSVLYIIFCTLCIALAITLFSRLSRQSRDAFTLKFPPYLNLTNVSIILIVLILISFYSFLTLGAGRRSYTSSLPQWVFYFINMELVVGLIIFMIIGNNHKNIIDRRGVILSISVVAFYIIVRSVSGSRYAIIHVLQSIIYSNIIYKGDFLISRKTQLRFVLGSIGAIIVYQYATFLRYAIWTGSSYIGQRMKTSDITRLLAGKEIEFSWEVINEMSGRMSHFDRLVNLLSNKGYMIEHYFNITHGIKSAINNLIPGEIYPGFDLMTKQYSVVFYGWNEIFAKDHYQTETLTSMGEYYIYFGFLGGGMACFIFAAIFTRIYEAKSKNGLSSYMLYSYILLGVFNGWLLSFGFDFQIVSTYKYLLGLVIYIYMIKYSKLMFSRG
jgi:hypothetical protein